MALRVIPNSGYIVNTAGALNTPRVTQMAWVKLQALPSPHGGLIGFMDGLGSPVLDKDLIVGSSGVLDYQVYDGATKEATSTGVLTVGQWYHVAATADGSNIRIFINGRPDGSAAAGNTYAAYTVNNLFVGAHGTRTDTTTRYTDVTVYDVAIWTEALTEAQIFSIAKRALSPLQVMPGNLAIYWRLPAHYGYQYDESGARDDAAPQGVYYVQSSSLVIEELFLAAGMEAGAAANIEPLFLNVGTGLFAPASITETGMFATFLNVGVGMFAPGFIDLIHAPFLDLGTWVSSPTVIDGGLPPFLPPSLPPTLPPGTPTGPGVPLPPLSSGGLAGIRFYQGPPWRWVVTDLASNTLTFLDRLADGAAVTYTLDKGWHAKLTVPSDNPEVNILHTDGEPFVSEGNRLLYGFRREGDSPLWVCRFGGKILMVEDVGYAEDARTTITAFDPRAIIDQRPMITYDFEFPDKAGFFSFDDTQYGVMALTFLRNTIVNNGEVGIDIGDKDFATVDNMPGTSFWGAPYQAVWSGRTKSKYETTTQVDTDFEQGMTVGEVWDQILQSGAIDLMLTPIYDPVNRPGYMAELSIYQRIGVQADDAVFAWDKPGRNVTQINSLKDGTKRANVVRYYWDQGGPPVGPYLGYADGASSTKYGETWHEQFWPARLPLAVDAIAQLQLLLMADGIHTVHVTPTPERMPFLFTEWFLGDTVPVFASDKMRAEIAGFERIYGIVLQIDENSYEQVPQVLISSDDVA